MKKNVKGILAAALSLSMVAAPCQMAFAATTSNVVSAREKANAALAREAAAQSMVLLENKGHSLPLKKNNKKIALFGGGAVRTIRGGTGSGDPFNGGLSGGGDVNVNQSERYNINIYNSFKKAGYDITTAKLLEDYAVGYDVENEKLASNPMATFAYPELTFTDDDLAVAAEGTDTAIYIVSRNAGEGADRSMTKTVTLTGADGQTQNVELGDYELSAVEKENLERVSRAFDNTIVVLNVGGVVDTKFFDEIEGLDSLLLMGQAGQEGGNALLDVVTGAVTPSGKLVATWAENYSDYPASETFAKADGNVAKELYSEGIYVGYRYFDTFGITPAYEFGYGKSYTDFDIDVKEVTADAEKVTVTATVTNIGDTYSGKEVVQVYFSAPDGQVEREYQELAAYGKTDVLAPGESQTLTLSYDTDAMAYYSEAEASYVLGEGTYYVRVGNSSRNTEVAAALELDQSKVTEILSNQLEVNPEENLQEWSKAGKTPYSYRTEEAEKAAAPVIAISANDIVTENHASEYEDEKVVTYTTDADYQPIQDYEEVQVVEKKDITLKDVYENKATMNELVAQMSIEELAKLNCGSGWGVANENSPIVGSNSATVPGAAGETLAYENYEIPSIVLADGPGGIRVKQSYEATNIETGEKADYYQYATAWPVHYMLAQSWDVELMERVGEAFGDELCELNITLLLGPSLNIHRDPLCGRNFEYFGEDPTIAGTMAAALTNGVQSKPGVGACLKHYAANNQETNRNSQDSVVSERALREIYLKGFEIAVKESQPMSIMTSYNKINGTPAADSYDLCTNLTRGEWGYKGLIMTDWNGGESTPSISMHAGNDLIMPGGASKAKVIMTGATDFAPVFDEKGQIGLSDEMMFMFTYKTAAWGDFAVSAAGTQTVDAVLGDGFTASVDGENILVNGEPIYREYRANFWAGTGNYTTPVTTDVASVSEDGKTITYRGNYADNNNICLGDVQKSAVNNLNIIMRSNDMARIYGTTAKSYREEFDNLKAYQSVTKSDVKAAGDIQMVKNGLDRVIALIESLDASEYTEESWNGVKEALEAAKAVRANKDAAQADLDAAQSTLLKAFGALEYGVQKLHLETAIQAAEAILELAENYVGDAGALEEAVKEGKVVLADKAATQEEVDNAAFAILDELAKLAKKADVSSLESLIEAAKNLLDGKYTDSSKKVLEDAIANAEAVLAEADRSESAISDAYTAIIDAIVNLQMKGNKAALAAMIAKAEEVLSDKDTYVASTIDGLEAVLANAKAVYNNENAVQDTVNKAAVTLTQKVAQARLMGDVNNDGMVSTGDSAVLLSAAAELAELDAVSAESADVNGDGAADTNDAVVILQFAAEKTAAF